MKASSLDQGIRQTIFVADIAKFVVEEVDLRKSYEFLQSWHPVSLRSSGCVPLTSYVRPGSSEPRAGLELLNGEL